MYAQKIIVFQEETIQKLFNDTLTEARQRITDFSADRLIKEEPFDIASNMAEGLKISEIDPDFINKRMPKSVPPTFEKESFKVKYEFTVGSSISKIRFSPLSYNIQKPVYAEIIDTTLIFTYDTRFFNKELSEEKHSEVKQYMGELKADWVNAIAAINNDIKEFNSTIVENIQPVIKKAKENEIAKRKRNDDLNNF